MLWYDEAVTGVENAIIVVAKLLPGLEPFQCIKVELDGLLKLVVFQKPWTGTNYLLSGNLSGPQAEELISIGKRLGLQHFGSVSSEECAVGLSFCSSVQTSDTAENCRQFLKALADESSRLSVQGLNAVVNMIPPQ